MANREQIDSDAQYWLDELAPAIDPEMGRRLLDAFLGALYRLYCSVWPEGDKDEFFGEMQSRDDYLILDVLTMLVRGSGVHNLMVDTETPHAQLYPSGKLFPSPYTFPGPQFHFPPRDPRMGDDTKRRGTELRVRREAYDRLIDDAPVLPTIYGALESLRALVRERESAQR